MACCIVEALILDEWKIPIDLHLYNFSYIDQYILRKVATYCIHNNIERWNYLVICNACGT
jgi:hypothetical protein